MSAPFTLINRDVVVGRSTEDPYLAIQFVDRNDGRVIFLGTIPVSYLGRRPTDTDVHDLADALRSSGGSARGIFDVMTKTAPDPRLGPAVRSMIAAALLDTEFPAAEDIVANAGFNSDGEFMDTDMLATDVSTLLAGIDPPRDIDEAMQLSTTDDWRVSVNGTSSFFGRRWFCFPAPENENTGSIRFQYRSDDESWARGWRLIINAVYPLA